jgi:DNA invertase Pin-like site-specific DNA recombinase
MKLIRHLCNNKACVNPRHLRLGTERENHEDRIAAGTAYTAAAEDHGNTRLTNKDVAALWTEYWAGGITYEALAEKYGIAKCTVSHIISGRNWSTVTSKLPKPSGRHPSVANLRRAVRKLSNEQVEELRQRYAEGGVSQSELAAEYKVSQPTVGKIVRGERY